MKPLPVRVCVLALVAVAVAACGSTTTGNGHAQSPTTSSSRPDFPSASQGGPASDSTSASTSASSSQPAPSNPTRQQRADRLTAQTNGEAHVLVAVAGGYEAATFDQHAAIQFWRSVGASVNWTQVGQSAYPYSAAVGAPADAHVSGALLHGMQHATFIVTGNFTGDGSGNAVAITTGTHGWGVIKAEADGNIGPSGRPVGADRIGLSYRFGFVGGMLKTEDCASDRPIADCDTDHIDKLWTWTGQDFKQS